MYKPGTMTRPGITHALWIALLTVPTPVIAMDWRSLGPCAQVLSFQAKPLASSNMATIELLETELGTPEAHVLKRKVSGVWLERVALRGFQSLELKRVQPDLITHALGHAEEAIVQELRVGAVDYRVVDSYRFQGGEPGLWIWQKSTLFRIEQSPSVPRN